MKTKVVLILLSFGLSCGLAYAADVEKTPMPVSNDINVTAPDQPGLWSFGVTAVLMQPTNQAFAYASLYTEVGTDIDGVVQETVRDNYKDVNQAYHWWFGADVTYAFPGNGRDVTLAYEGLHGNDTDQASGTADSLLYDLPYKADEYATAKGETQTNYDAGDLVFGQKLNVGARVSLHPFVGLRYAHIEIKDTANYSDCNCGPGVFLDHQITWDSTFNGIGPRLGSDAEINFAGGFSLRGRVGVSALIGSLSPDYSYLNSFYNAAGDLESTYDYSAGHGSSTHVIPEIDGRLGLNYTYDFNSGMALGVEAGWQATNYFNSIDQVTGENAEVTTNNFGVQGPYARLQLDVA